MKGWIIIFDGIDQIANFDFYIKLLLNFPC